MFHKQDDELQRLNQELLAAEEEESEDWDEELSEEELQEYGEDFHDYEEDFASSYEEEYDSSDYAPNASAYYGKGKPKLFDFDAYLDSEQSKKSEVIYRDDTRQYEKKKKKKGITNLALAILAVLEILAIAGIAIWWATWML